MAGVLCGVNLCCDPPQRSTFYAHAHQGRQASVFQAKVGEEHAQLLMETRTTGYLLINVATFATIGIPIWGPLSTQKQG